MIALPATSRITSSSYSFQRARFARSAFHGLGKDRGRVREFPRTPRDCTRYLRRAAHCETRAQDHRIADAIREFEPFSTLFTSCESAFRVRFSASRLKQETVFGFLNRIDLRANQFHAILSSMPASAKAMARFNRSVLRQSKEARRAARGESLRGKLDALKARYKCGRRDSDRS